MDGEAKLRHLAGRQHAAVSQAQIRAVGLSRDDVKRLVASGRWRRDRWRALVVAGAPRTYEQSVTAAVLAAGDHAIASELTAAKLWGLRLPQPDSIDILTATPNRVRLTGVRHHRTNLLPRADVSRIRRIPTTSPTRTLCDASGLVTVGQLGLAVDDALRRNVVSLERLRACHERLDSGGGRRPTAAMREVLRQRRRGYDPGASDRERRVGDVLEAAGLPRPTPRYRVRIGNKTYELDHAFAEFLVAIEFDGWDVHGTTRRSTRTEPVGAPWPRQAGGSPSSRHTRPRTSSSPTYASCSRSRGPRSRFLIARCGG